MIISHSGREYPPSWYDAAYLAQDTKPRQPAHAMRQAEMLWLPALRQCVGSVLDIGCGPGYVGELAYAMGLDYAGVDSSAVAIKIACRGSDGAYDCAHWSDIDDDIWAAADTVLLLEVLEHLQSDVMLLDRIPANKRVVYSVPNFYTPGHLRHYEHPIDAVQAYQSRIAHDQYEICTSNGKNMWWLHVGTKR